MTHESMQAINDSAVNVGYNVRRTLQENNAFGWELGSVIALLIRMLHCESQRIF